MSTKRKKGGLVISWQKSFTDLLPWRKGKGDKNAVVDSDIVLTKMKLLSNFQEKLLVSSPDSESIMSTVSVDTSKAPTGAKVYPHPEDRPQVDPGSDHLSEIFSGSQLAGLYKFESEDSGVELPSGAGSSSTPTGSEHSLVVHSRESSCGSCHVDSDAHRNLVAQSSENSEDSGSHILSNELSALSAGAELHTREDVEQSAASETGAEGGWTTSDHLPPEGGWTTSDHLPPEGGWTTSDHLPPASITLKRKHGTAGACEDTVGGGGGGGSVGWTATCDSLEDYGKECCRLSEAQQESSDPLNSGLGYLRHICQLIEKIAELQETNLRLQRHVYNLQRRGSWTKNKEELFLQHCHCGAASSAFQDLQRSQCLSPSGTLWDPSTSTGLNSENLAALWRRNLDTKSPMEGEAKLLGSSIESSFSSLWRLSPNNTWGRVRDLVKRTKLRRTRCGLGQTSSTLKMSCPQLYRPDLKPERLSRRNRNSVSLDHCSKLDFPWLE